MTSNLKELTPELKEKAFKVFFSFSFFFFQTFSFFQTSPKKKELNEDETTRMAAIEGNVQIL